ncbi:DUF6127 family protein [Sphingomonas sp.]|uniref:DUF6127 family protein n=1 Tax=Sphingomonas sp. TaxID=28214 RepID=UPI0025F41575|nr:DUF6127 family protein [Sphingomonas sp.]
MSDTMLTAHLLAQAESGASDLVTLRALVEEASELGARRALARLGLADEDARTDVTELRELLKAWRDAKTSVRHAVIGWVVRGAMAAVLIGIAVKLGLGALVLK